MDGALIPNVEAVGVSKRFPGVLAVDGVDMAVRPGEARALAGQNGSGKSTLIKIVAGVYRPDAGTVKVGETPVAFRSPPEAVAAGISTIHQEVNLIPPRSVAENLFLAREPKRGPFIDQRRLVRDSEEILARYGLAGLLGAGRTELAEILFGVARRTGGDGFVSDSGRLPDSPGEALASGMSLVPEDRRAQGIFPGQSVRENVIAAALPKLTRRGLIDRAAVDALVGDLVDMLDIQLASLDQPIE